ncbi:kinase domain protein (macronuclear) [Tetrahymena thermophila SB210]|uniref:Kinase domain protein n=1 Tax=Tetrahymena thermophila (strain SB210) TaxID=312017 RepID=I7MIY1_TETTS|nr:kinase domain protein [Tetrahymena thermophila SB210]EAS04833.2 kinase domain protein [Tetrahymena thermophila SB210]|eukprot:XP_001025078.2 kinase domain protein [Tetrahymena thermophila SB210]
MKSLEVEDIEQAQAIVKNQDDEKKQLYLPQEPVQKTEMEYSRYQIPPNFQIAHQHQIANLVGYESKESKDLCVCCARQINKQKINLLCNLRDLSFLGSGYPLYFSFLKYCEVFLCLILLTSGGYNMLTNAIYGQDCKEDNEIEGQDTSQICKKNWITVISLGNKQEQKTLMFVQEILNLATVIIIIILLQIFRRYQRKLDSECDEADISANDYTLLFENIPLEFDAINSDYDDDLKLYVEKDISKMLNQESSTPNQCLEVVKVILCYNLKELQQLNDRHSELIKQKQNTIKQMNKGKIADTLILENINKKIADLDDQILRFQEKFVDGKGKEFMKQYFTGKALVSLKTEQMKEQVLNFAKDSKRSKELIYQNQVVQIKQAPYPSDMYWENLHITQNEKNKRFVKGFCITILALAGCAGLIYLLLFIQKQQKPSQNQNTSQQSNALVQSIAILLSIAITILNFLLQIVLKYLTNIEGCYTRTEFNISIAKKMAWATFINTSLIQFFIDVVLSDSKKFGAIFSEGGIAYNQNYVFMFNMVIPFVMGLIDFPGIFKKVKQKMLSKQVEKCYFTQEQLNTLYEYPQYNISQQYANNLKTMFMVAFYSPIIPVGILYSMVAILLMYWVDKFNILRRKTIKFSQSAELSIEMTEMIEYILPIYSLSNALFLLYIVGIDYVSVVSWISLGIGLIHAALPMQLFNEKMFEIAEAPPNLQDFYQAEQFFTTDYDRENPAYQLIVLNKYTKKEQENKSIQINNNIQLKNSTPKKLQQSIFKSNNEDVIQKHSDHKTKVVHEQGQGSNRNKYFSSEKMYNSNLQINFINSKQETADTNQKISNLEDSVC